MKHEAGEARSKRRHLEGRGHIGTTLRKTNQNLGDSETQRLGDSVAQQLGDSATRDIGDSVTWDIGHISAYEPHENTRQDTVSGLAAGLLSHLVPARRPSHQEPRYQPVGDYTTKDLMEVDPLGARGGVLTQYITNTLQGNGQRT
jgi:hypothetical protein